MKISNSTQLTLENLETEPLTYGSIILNEVLKRGYLLESIIVKKFEKN